MQKKYACVANFMQDICNAIHKGNMDFIIRYILFLRL